MSIQWYPGHMTKARRVLAESIPSHDILIEVLDARMPRASSNPVLTELRGSKPCLKVLGKSDLADPAATEAWLRYFAEACEPTRELPNGSVAAVAITRTRQADTRKVIAAMCKRLVLHPGGLGKTVRAMVVGIPNVGKSTLINTLMERKVAKVGDEPAVTKGQQLAILKNGMAISDHPGLLWPNIEDPAVGDRLALGGAISDAAIDYESVAMFGAEYLLKRYPALLVARYKLKETPPDAQSLLIEIGKRRGALRAGGAVDLHKASDVLVHDFRSGAIGRISLELPALDSD